MKVPVLAVVGSSSDIDIADNDDDETLPAGESDDAEQVVP